MKIWTTDHLIEHPWDKVVKAVWRKYPNPLKPEVLSTDVVDRKVDNGILRTQRVLGTEWGFPDWAVKFVGTQENCFAHESSMVNHKKKEMAMRTHNITLASRVSLDEKLVYFPNPEDKNTTILRQETLVAVHGVPLSSFIENYLIKKIINQSLKGKEALEYVINKINLEVDEQHSKKNLNSS